MSVDHRAAPLVSLDAKGCWNWLGSKASHGYGFKHIGQRRHQMAHRWVYQLLVGPISAGLDLDHLCRNRLCVNPAHLEPVTHAENVRRGQEALGIVRYKTHCPQGHEYTAENTYYRSDRAHPSPGRNCRQCALDRGRARVAAMPEAERKTLRRESARRRREKFYTQGLSKTGKPYVNPAAARRLTPSQRQMLLQGAAAGVPVKALAADFSISRSAAYALIDRAKRAHEDKQVAA